MSEDMIALLRKIEWARSEERNAANTRRKLEDQLVQMLEVPETLEGVETIDNGVAEIKVTGRINRRIDSDLLQELAHEAGVFDHLQTLFRWRPSIDMRAWRAADPSITEPLMAAITAKPGRPSIAIKFTDDTEEK